MGLFKLASTRHLIDRFGFIHTRKSKKTYGKCCITMNPHVWVFLEF